jgi:segregation and condensation protein B
MSDTPEHKADENQAEEQPAPEQSKTAAGEQAKAEAPEQAAAEEHAAGEHPAEESPAVEAAAESGEEAPVVEEAMAGEDAPVEEAAAEESADSVPAENYAHKLELILEALLLAADGPLALDQMQKLVGSEFNLGRKDLRAALERMGERYANSACELREVASGWRLQVRPEYGEWVGRLWQEKPPKYSRALLETLALIVYRQPITRGEIEQIRGVAVNPNIVKTLLERGWIRVIGHRDVPGKPELLGTTREFLDYFSLKKLDDLPTLAQLKELEDMRVQLSLPGAEAVAEAAEASDAAGAADAGTGDSADLSGEDGADGPDSLGADSASDEDELDAAEAEPRPQGLVARGPGDDAD